MGQCDVCNADTTWEEATVYTPDEFRRLVSLGFRPDEDMMNLLAGNWGMSRDQAVAQWKQGLVAESTTDWVLCPGCALVATRSMPKAKGTGLRTEKEWEPVTPAMLRRVDVPPPPPTSPAKREAHPDLRPILKQRKWWQFWRPE